MVLVDMGASSHLLTGFFHSRLYSAGKDLGLVMPPTHRSGSALTTASATRHIAMLDGVAATAEHGQVGQVEPALGERTERIVVMHHQRDALARASTAPLAPVTCTLQRLHSYSSPGSPVIAGGHQSGGT